MSTATAPAPLDVNLTADVRCVGVGAFDPCPHGARADLLAETCARNRVPMCWKCWHGERVRSGWCRTNERDETRDQHYRIVEELS